MANYSINVTDNLNGSYTLQGVFRAPTTVASGGTTLNAAAQVLDAASNSQSSWTALGDILQRGIIMALMDKAKNG